MKKLILSATAVIVLAASVVGMAQGQAPRTQPETGPIGLIDMAHVFKNYKKFEAMTKDLQAEIQQSEAKLKAAAQQLKELAEQGQQLKTTVNESSPQFIEHEKRFTQAATEFESMKKIEQREFLRKEAQIYKTIYLEVADAVEQAANHYKYSVVLRFSREEIDAAGDPKELIQSMNRQVVFHRAEDDITDAVLAYLNKNYDRTAGGAAAGAAPAGSTATKPATGATR